jgi:hypothetical protein
MRKMLLNLICRTARIGIDFLRYYLLLIIVSFIKTSSVTLDPFNGSEATCHGFCSLFHYAFELFKADIGMECLKKFF